MPNLRESLTSEPVALKFGTSGLRGLVTDMTDLECYINTLGFLRYVQTLQGKPAQQVYIGGDLRFSTPRIMAAVAKAVTDAGYEPINCGFVPTPTVAHYALQHQSPSVMVTGSHIPDDRNGIKFYRPDGEPLKSDEAPIFDAVAVVRQKMYEQDAAESIFDENGMLREAFEMPNATDDPTTFYAQRYANVFDSTTLAGKEIVFYQHSAVGRDLLPQILTTLGANVICVDRSEKFISIDTENVTPEDEKYFRNLAVAHPNAFAIISTDGDSDRPFVVDAEGTFHRGDVLGAVVADWLGADFAAFPISVSDATDGFLTEKNVAFTHTRIGSPYVIAVMQESVASGRQRVVGWEVNGGFMLGSDVQVGGKQLAQLATRDALLPIIVVLKAAIDAEISVKELFGRLPARATQQGLIDNFPTEVSAQILAKFSVDSVATRLEIEQYFSAERGFGKVTGINVIDGLRIFFDNGDIAHMRPSGNAPQLRCYSVANTQTRADEIVSMALAEPSGIFREIERQI